MAGRVPDRRRNGPDPVWNCTVRRSMSLVRWGSLSGSGDGFRSPPHHADHGESRRYSKPVRACSAGGKRENPGGAVFDAVGPAGTGPGLLSVFGSDGESIAAFPRHTAPDGLRSSGKRLAEAVIAGHPFGKSVASSGEDRPCFGAGSRNALAACETACHSAGHDPLPVVRFFLLGQLVGKAEGKLPSYPVHPFGEQAVANAAEYGTINGNFHGVRNTGTVGGKEAEKCESC